MRKLVLLLAVVGCLGMTGCASKLMQPISSPESVNAKLSQDEAALVFLRATSFGGAVQAPVIEATGGKLQLVGIVSAKMKILYKTTPGKHLFVVGGESSNLLEADLEGGKTYYAYVSPRMGLWKARFVFVPVTDAEAATEEFKKDLAWCEWHENGPEAQAWFTENISSLRSKYADAQLEHEKAKPEAKKRIKPEYGLSVPAQ